MATTTSNINSEISGDKITRIRKKLLKQVEYIKNQDVNERVINGLLRVLQYFAIKSTRKEYDLLNDLILRYMGIILDVEMRCITVHLKETFDNIIPELTEWCGIIAINSENAPFLLQFFSIWSEIVSAAGRSIQRYTGLNKIPALINICETIFKTGHFQAQLNGLELFLRYIGACEEEEKEKILENIIPAHEYRKIRDLLCNFDYSNFEFDGRDFLNEFNMIISEEEPVYSIAVEKGYIGEKPIIKPMHNDKECVFWVDFNSATESVSFYCQSTTFFPDTAKWTNIEVKFPKKINIDRREREFHVFANRDDIEVYPSPAWQIFSQPKIIFRFTYNENDLIHLQKVISCYNFKKKTNNVPIYAECDRFYTGFKTVNAETNQDNFDVGPSTNEWLEPKLPPPKIDTLIKNNLPDLISKKSSQNGLQIVENVMVPINKKQKYVLASKSDISSAQNTSIGNKKLSTEEIVSTSDTSKINMQKTTTLKTIIDNSNANVAECETVTKDSKLNIGPNKKAKTAKGKPDVSVNKKNDQINNRKPFKEMTNVASGSQKAYFKKPGKQHIETIVHDNAIRSDRDEMKTVEHDNQEISKVVSGNQKTYANISSKMHTETIAHDNREIVNVNTNQHNNTEKSGKAEIETVIHDCNFPRKSQNVTAKTSRKTKIKTFGQHKIPNDTNSKNEMHNSPEITSRNTILELKLSGEKNKTSDQIPHENHTCSSETNAEKALYTELENPPQSPKSASKRKLYTPTAEVHVGSQLSKDSQLQRRKYLQERRKTENRNSLKLVNLVKPLEFSEKNDEVKDQDNSNIINAPIAGNEEQIQNTVEEYVNNKGYVGIKSSLKCPSIAAKFTPQQQKTIQNNLKTLNSIFVKSAKKFFKSESTLHIEQLDVYDVRTIEEDPAPVKKGRKRNVKGKVTPPIKMNIVPKYIGENTKVSHSYRRSKRSNLGNMKKILTTGKTDFDKLKQGFDSNTANKKSEPVNAVGALIKRQSARLKKNITYESSEDSVIKVDPMQATVTAGITTDVFKNSKIVETSQRTLRSENLKNIQEEENTQAQQGSNQSLNPLSNQGVHGKNSNKSLNRNYASEEDITHPFVGNEAMNKTTAPSPEFEICNSAMTKQSMVPNTSFEAKDLSDNCHETQQGNNFEKQSFKRISDQNHSHERNSMGNIIRHSRVRLTEVKPGKYTSYDHNLNRNIETSLDRSNCPSSTITVPPQEVNTNMNVEPNWLIKKYLNSLPDGINLDAQTSYDLDFKDYLEEHCLNNLEDDNVDLDSYWSLEYNDFIGNEEGNNVKDQTRNVENSAEQKLAEFINLESRLQAGPKNDSFEKRKLPDPENKQLVPYKRVRTETTMDCNDGGIGGEILSNLRTTFHQFFARALSDIRNNSGSKEIKERLLEQLSTFMMSCDRHNFQSFESWKQIQKLLAEIDKEKERFHLESFAVFNQFSKTQEALAELKNTSKTKDAEKLVRFEKVRSGMKETVARIAKAEWEGYIDNLTSNIIKNIKRHIDFDLQF